MRAIDLTALGALLLGLPACALDIDLTASSSPIIGGDSVADDAFPSVGAVTTNAGTICTGTLIGEKTVLTAAHCVEPDLIRQSLEAAGQTAPDEIVYEFTFSRDIAAAADSDMLEVASVAWHPEFLQDLSVILQPGVTQWNDIAVLHLAEAVTDRPVQELAPTDVTEALETDRLYAVAGYGLTDDDDQSSAGVLTSGQSGLDELGEFELIAGEGDAQQACRGDSGGPIFADDGDTFQIGIASRINADVFPPPTEPPPCETGLLYTRIDPYLPWIEANMDGIPPDGDDGDPDPDGDEDAGGGDGDEDGDGGGCSTTGGQGGGGVALLALALVLGLGRRRTRP